MATLINHTLLRTRVLGDMPPTERRCSDDKSSHAKSFGLNLKTLRACEPFFLRPTHDNTGH
jgi:hypothetical protein